MNGPAAAATSVGTDGPPAGNTAAPTAAAGAVRQLLAKPFASVQLLVLAGSGLLGFGVLMAVSTTIAAARDNGGTGSIWNQAVKEVVFIAVGLVVFWVAARSTPRTFRLISYPMLAIAVVSLVVVLIPGIGVGVYGARRWIDVGPLQLQPSEFAKLAMLLWSADLLARKQQLRTLKRARHLFVPLLPGFAIVVALVMAEPDLGTTLCFMLILLGVLWMVGMPMRYFAGLVGVVAAAVTLLAITEPYRLQRLTTFVNPFKNPDTTGYHTVEGLYALASGGVFGVGLGQGTSKYGWVPNANSDYVFAIIGEELGLVGCLMVLTLFALLTYTGMRIVRRNADPFVRIAAGGATIWLAGQAVINIGYVSSLLPVTGIPLPLISAGGTSLIVTFFVLGMLDLLRAPRTRGRQRRATCRSSRSAHPPRTPGPHPGAPALRRAQNETEDRAEPRRPTHDHTAGRPAHLGTADRPPGPGHDRRVCRPFSSDAPVGGAAGSTPADQLSAPAATGPRVVVAGGGTAGHIEPAMNLADAVRRLDPSAEITALGTPKGLDTTLIPPRGYPLELVPPVPLPRRLGGELLRTPGRVRQAVAAASAVLARVEAEVVVGFGGYVAVPAYLAARRLSIPIVVHEANAKPGVANRGAARLTTHVFTASAAGRLPHGIPIGIPLRPAISRLDRASEREASRVAFGLRPDLPTLLVFGGSQGARSINTAAAGAAAGLRDAGVQVLHIVGPKNDLAVDSDPEVPYLVVPYVEKMQQAYAAADFALCRCGAMTCAELAAVGLPAAYVPYPVGNGEQRFNAMPTVAAGGGLLVDDADLDPTWILSQIVPRLRDRAVLTAMSRAAEGAGARDADVVLATRVLAVAAEYRRFSRGGAA